MTKRKRKGFKAHPAAGMWKEYERFPTRRLSAEAQRKSLEGMFKDLAAFDLDKELEKFLAQYTRAAESMLRHFVKMEGLPKPDPLRAEEQSHLIKKRIGQIRTEAEPDPQLRDPKLRRRLAYAGQATDALEMLGRAEWIPVYIKHAVITKSVETDLSAWRALAAAFELGEAYTRARTRSIEARVGITISESVKAIERNRETRAHKYKERSDAYNVERENDPNATDWNLCERTGIRLNIGPRAVKRSIPPSERVPTRRVKK